MSNKLQLNEIVDIISGMAFRSSDADPKGSIPVINASSIIAGSILSDFSEMKKITELPTRSPAVVQNEDILMVSRATPGNPFKTSVVKTDQPLIATSSLYILRVKGSQILPQYLNHFLNSSSFQRNVIDKARGSTISHITRHSLGDIPIPIPSIKHQELIIKLKTNVEEQKKINNRRQRLKDEILQETFNNLYIQKS